MAGDKLIKPESSSNVPFQPFVSGLNFNGILASAATTQKERHQSGASGTSSGSKPDVWNLSDLDEVTREIPVDTPYVCFRRASEYRQHRVVAIDEMNKGIFYVNRDAIKRVAPLLERRISGVSKNHGTVYRDGQIRIGVVEFEILLRLICNSYEGLSRTNAIGKYMKRMLILSDRYEIQSLIKECKQLVKTANYEHVSIDYAVKWFEGFEYGKLDEEKNYYGDITRLMRATIIAGIINANRWQLFGNRIGRIYSEALQSGSIQLHRRVKITEVDQVLREYFDRRHGGSSQQKPSQPEQLPPRVDPRPYPNLMLNSPLMNYDPIFPVLF